MVTLILSLLNIKTDLIFIFKKIIIKKSSNNEELNFIFLPILLLFLKLLGKFQQNTGYNLREHSL